MGVKVLNPGILTTVQDLGRVGYQEFGVSVSGAMDPRALKIANILAGNEENEACLECTMMGPMLQFDEANVIAIGGGDLGASIDGKPVPPCSARHPGVYRLCRRPGYPGGHGQPFHQYEGKNRRIQGKKAGEG